MAAAKQRAAAEMHRIDTDGDGSISRAEFVAAGGKQSDFDRFDWDGSGSLDRDELEAMAAAKQRAAAEMHRIDTDGDGSISRAEFAAAGGECSERPHSTSRQTIYYSSSAVIESVLELPPVR